MFGLLLVSAMTKSEMEQYRVRTTARPVKLIPPEVGHIYVRQPLKERLDRLLISPGKIWISSPGGAGKTALVRNLLVEDSRPLFWYQVDSEDRDPANLFYYLAQAVAEKAPENPSLPLLEPEYLPNLEIFCRNFCQAMFAGIGTPCVLVFDDLQEGPGESLFGPFLSALMAELPAASSLLIISREEPYQRFARERVNRTLAHLSWDDLRLSVDETRCFLHWLQKKEPSQQLSDQAYSLTQGWLAGLLLYLENSFDGERPQQKPFESTGLLFDYFTGEIFSCTPSANREFLLLCSLLPSIDVSMAESLTGRSDAAEILGALVLKNQFTYRIASSPETYRFHPLFRHFLLSRADLVLGREECLIQRKQAARLLVEAERFGPAAELLIEARAWAPLMELIYSRAEGLLRQGRSHTLLQWLDAVPSQMREQDPWFCYWRGVCLMATNPPLAMQALTRAFELFDDRADAAGSMRAWGMVVNAIIIAWDNYTVLDQWIERFDHLLARYRDYPSLEIESLMVQGICKSLAWRYPERTDLPVWAERLHQLVISSNDSDFRLLAGSNLVLYHLVSGSVATAKSLVEVLNSDLHAIAVSPLKKLIWLGTRGALEWVLLDRDASLATIKAGRSIIEASGVHVMDVRIYSQGIILGLTTGDLSLVRRLFAEMPAMPIITSLDHAYHTLLQADQSLLEGDIAKALALAETAAKQAADCGNVVIEAMSLCIFIMVLYRDGQFERAANVLQKGLELTSGMSFFRSSMLLMAAFFALEKEDVEMARELLRNGFVLARMFHPGT
jgi:ATP/maltotriose-dependent transcriptional regulator MalT